MVRARARVTSLAKANLPQGGGGGFLPTQMESEAQLWPLTWLSQALNPLLPKLSHKPQQLLRKEPLQICRLRSAPATPETPQGTPPSSRLHKRTFRPSASCLWSAASGAGAPGLHPPTLLSTGVPQAELGRGGAGKNFEGLKALLMVQATQQKGLFRISRPLVGIAP